MDDPGWTWPAWKFGMKRDDLLTKLHDQYNTITSTIQDPEAFHHDVYEISTVASNPDEFHRLLAERKQQRVHELNQSLESASFEIVANPELIGTDQWQLAVQLFRTKSLDALVRYFGSYLPDCHPWHRTRDDGSDSAVDCYSAPASAVGEDDFYPPSHDYEADVDYHDITGKGLIMDEPESMYPGSRLPASHLPPSPRSMTMCSDDSTAVSSSIESAHDDLAFKALSPVRSMSMSESETDALAFSGTTQAQDDIETSQPDEADTPITSVSDLSELRSVPDDVEAKNEDQDEPSTPATQIDEEDRFAMGSKEEDSTTSETPTPRTTTADSYMSVHRRDALDTKTGQLDHAPLYSQLMQKYTKSSARRSSPRRGAPPNHGSRRTSPEVGRVGKPKEPIGSKSNFRQGRVHIL